MARWKEAALTNDGAEMLNEWMAGRKITITSTYEGTGTVDPELLTEQTGLVDMRQKLHLLGEEDGADGKTVRVQVQRWVNEYPRGILGGRCAGRVLLELPRGQGSKG